VIAGKARSLAAIAAAQVLALSVWFAGAAALPGLAEHGLSAIAQAALSSAVQIGFVTGALTSAILTLPDRFEPRRLFAAGALTAAIATAACLVVPPGGGAMIALRALTGAALALVYPVGMKLAASWAKGDAGLLVGLLVGALTLGSAAPHLFNLADAGLGWKAPFAVSAILAALSAPVIFLGAAGPAFRESPPFRLEAVLTAVRDPALRLANAGYLGHMWELYAFWAWVGPGLHAAWGAARAGHADLAAFLVIAAGSAGALSAGWLADRHGRTTIAGGAMAASGLCALLTVLVWPLGPWAVTALWIVYGVVVIADSAQFSASVAELAPPELAGSMLTVQTAAGFALTVVTVQLLPLWIDAAGWAWAFAPLAIGPFLGVWAMILLRRRPEAEKLAGGRG